MSNPRFTMGERCMVSVGDTGKTMNGKVVGSLRNEILVRLDLNGAEMFFSEDKVSHYESRVVI